MPLGLMHARNAVAVIGQPVPVRKALARSSTSAGSSGGPKAPAANCRLSASRVSTAAPTAVNSNRSPSSETSRSAAALPRSHSRNQRGCSPVRPARSPAVTVPRRPGLGRARGGRPGGSAATPSPPVCSSTHERRTWRPRRGRADRRTYSQRSSRRLPPVCFQPPAKPNADRAQPAEHVKTSEKLPDLRLPMARNPSHGMRRHPRLRQDTRAVRTIALTSAVAVAVGTRAVRRPKVSRARLASPSCPPTAGARSYIGIPPILHAFD